ncbi:MAG: sugar phosphate isomerase [Phycisphaerae bacterium]|nr:sugar phosphate isomerase [Phycisphaerae bacterium]
MNYEEKARHFVENEKQFHLGFLPTEQSNPKTSDLSEVITGDTATGIDMLLSVDENITVMTADIFQSRQFAKLVCSMVDSIRNGGRIIFSGCGATGRLAILLDACWRSFWKKFAKQNRPLAERFDIADMENRTVSVMTGGDRALIRSVENFEDFPQFGRQQMREINVSRLDTVVAITEGGETSSVLGTALESLDVGASVFLMFNNPADVLAANIERSRELIEHPEVTVLDLCCGSMAIAGSTRMQATTSEMLVASAAIELTLREILSDRLSDGELTSIHAPARKPADYAAVFAELLGQLRSDENLATLAELAEFEQNLYQSNGLITYLANDYLLDILTDTTERAPTFMLPPFRKSNDEISPPSWAFVKNPMLPTHKAWAAMLRREPNGLTWNRDLYVAMHAPQSICQAPLQLDNKDIYKFDIGNEDNPSRWAASNHAAMLVLVGQEVTSCTTEHSEFMPAAERLLQNKYERYAILAIGECPPVDNAKYEDFSIICNLPPSLTNLWEHQAIKLVMNTVSTATMVRMGRVYGNWMVYAETTNKKLIDRSARFIQHFTNVTYREACRELFKTLDQLAQIKDQSKSPIPPTIITIERIKREQREITTETPVCCDGKPGNPDR